VPVARRWRNYLLPKGYMPDRSSFAIFSPFLAALRLHHVTIPDVLPRVQYIFFVFSFISQHVSEQHNSLSISILPLLLWKDCHFVVGMVGELVSFVIYTFYLRREIYVLI
jgi:hypothetical protein